MTQQSDQLLSKQEAKSIDMQRRVCAATVSVLAEVGYERVSTKLISERGKMSRGALNYHFPTKNDLFVAAYNHVLAEWDQHWPFCDLGPNETLTTEALIDALWTELFSKSTYLAILELMLAARLDPDLSVQLRASLAKWSKKRDQRTIQMMGLDPEDHMASKLLRINLCMLRGICVNRFCADGTYAEEPLIEIWKDILAREMKSHFATKTIAHS
jgi:AcrR family transcriptional regulator